MYSSERNSGFNLKDILVKILFLVIFVLLVIWLFPKVPNMKAFYSNVFRENIKYMQDAAESYYTTDRLPVNVGDSVEMTLQEMIDKNLILPFVDKDGNSCDTKASYVSVTKNKEDYTMLVNLVCPTEKNTLKKVLGCHDYCENCDSKKVTEYEFAKDIITQKTSYSCPNGGKLENGMCNVYTTSTYAATATTTNNNTYSCPNGYSLSGTKCVKNNVYTYDANRNINDGGYYCPQGGELSGTTCVVKSSSIETINATYKAGTSSSVAATVSTVGGSTYAATATNGTHKLNGYYTSKPDGYTCSYGVTPQGCTTCKAFTYYYYNCTATKTTYSCPNGGSLDSTGRTCVISGTNKYTCPSGYTLSGTTCYKNTTGSYTCPSGYTLSGTMCTKTTTSTSYTYQASKNANNVTYYCNNSSHTLNGDKCSYTVQDVKDATKNASTTTYSCPKGGTLNNQTCTISTLTNSYKPTSSTSNVTTTDYKWSTKETLDGYKKTGKTREVDA